MDAAKILEMSQRIERLEATCGRLELRAQRWRMVGGLAFLGAILLIVSGARAPDVPKIRAEEFVLVDKVGRERAALCLEPDGSPRLNFRYNNGNCALSIGLEANGKTGLSFYDDQENLRVGMSHQANQETGLAFFRGGEKRIGFGLNSDGESILGFGGRDGGSMIQLRAQEQGTCDLVAFDGKGMKTFNLHIDKDGSPYVGLIGKDGDPLFQVPDGKAKDAK